MNPWQRLRRGYVRRLVLPLFRGEHPPEYMARGVFVGLFIALTPTVGVQMPGCLLLWGLLKFLKPEWDFNLVVAMAWTWVTNIFTLAPFYYLFLLTGRVMMGEWDSLSGYHDFQQRLAISLAVEADWWTTLWIYLVSLFREFGVPMFIGSLPWAALFSVLGYRWSLDLTRKVYERRAARKKASD